MRTAGTVYTKTVSYNEDHNNIRTRVPGTCTHRYQVPGTLCFILPVHTLFVGQAVPGTSTRYWYRGTRYWCGLSIIHVAKYVDGFQGNNRRGKAINQFFPHLPVGPVVGAPGTVVYLLYLVGPTVLASCSRKTAYYCIESPDNVTKDVFFRSKNEKSVHGHAKQSNFR